VALIGIVLSPAAEDVQNLATKFGWKSKTQLKKDLNESKFAVNAAVKSNEDLNQVVEKQAKSNDAVVEAVDQKHKADAGIESKSEEIKKQRKQRIEQIDLKYKDLPKSPELNKDKDKEVAATQIASIWATYCSFNEHEQCSPISHS
jgi:FtsZ-interacting cell division protein ZipA